MSIHSDSASKTNSLTDISPQPERMIRCETCDLVFHLPCIKPALREIPQGEWFCKGCSPEVVPESPKKKFKVSKAEDEEESLVEVSSELAFACHVLEQT